MPQSTDFNEVFVKLREILKPYAGKLVLASDTDRHYSLSGKTLMKNKHPVSFAGVTIGRAYVSFHLMPVYACPDMLEAMSPDLRKRMQGKSCFNFKAVDEKLFKELSKLTKTGFARFKALKYL